MDQEFKARAGSEREAYKSIVNQVHAYLRRTSRTRHYWEIQRTEWKPTELFGGGELKAHVWIKDSKMTKNNLMKFIDSCVGNIARKIEDEFNESDQPRDKGGKFTSKGGEGRGGASKKTKAHEPPVEETEFEKSAKEELNGKKGNVITTSMEFTGDEEDAKQLAKKYGFDYKLKYPKGSPYATIEMTGDKDALRKYAVNEGFGSEEDAREFVPELFEESEEDDEGYMGVSKEELAEEEEYENARERARREKDDDRVTGPEDRDYMNEEDDDDAKNRQYMQMLKEKYPRIYRTIKSHGK